MEEVKRMERMKGMEEMKIVRMKRDGDEKNLQSKLISIKQIYLMQTVYVTPNL